MVNHAVEGKEMEKLYEGQGDPPDRPEKPVRQ